MQTTTCDASSSIDVVVIILSQAFEGIREKVQRLGTEPKPEGSNVPTSAPAFLGMR